MEWIRKGPERFNVRQKTEREKKMINDQKDFFTIKLFHYLAGCSNAGLRVEGLDHAIIRNSFLCFIVFLPDGLSLSLMIGPLPNCVFTAHVAKLQVGGGLGGSPSVSSHGKNWLNFFPVFNSCERKFYNLCPVWSLFAAMTTIKS
jgi:hypothetical protein